MQRRNYTDLSEAEKNERAKKIARGIGKALTSLALWGGVTWLAFKYLHPVLIGVYCVGAGLFWLGKGAAMGFQYYLKKRLAEDVHLLPNLHDVLRQNREMLGKSIGNFNMPEMEQIVSWRGRAPGAPSTEPEFLHYTCYVKGEKSRAWLRARGFQQGDAWVLEKVFVDILSPDADQKLRKEEEEIDAGTFKRDPSEDKSEEDLRTYFTSDTVTLYDSKPENKVVDLDADQVEVIEKETRQKIEQLKKDGEYKF
jgi:hypothetical protein